MAFDLSSAFDTVDKAQLLPKLKALGIRGTELAWFKSYLSGGKQCVDWDGTISELTEVLFGVRQGSILGPILYLILVADMPDFIGIGEEDNSGYADDTAIWAMGRDLASIKVQLEERAHAFANFAAGNGLVLNATKTQLLVGGRVKAKDTASFVVVVDGTEVSASRELELLGVKFDQNFSTLPHDEHVAKSARQRAGLIARLTHHLPKGEYLRQLARGLLIGKLEHAAAAVIPPCFGESTPLYKSTQVAINDVARSITGRKRTDHVRIPDLLHSAGLPSINELAVRAVAVETWKAYHSSDGSKGERNPLGKFIFPSPATSKMSALSAPTPLPDPSMLSRSTRSRTAGIIIPLPLRIRANTFAVHAADIWNESPELRAAPTRNAASAVAKSLAKSRSLSK